jgi:plastocyanin
MIMRIISIFLVATGLCFTGCNRTQSSSATPGRSSSEPKVAIDQSTTGSISGTVHFAGTAPAPVKIDMGFDPACAMSPRGENFSSPIAAKDGKLANVYVYVKNAPVIADWAVPKEHVVVDQVGCRYEPHVVGAMVGHTIEFRNSDNTEHNIHAMPNQNPGWNESEAPKSQPLLKHFDEPEVMLPVKCNQHPWMKMYVNVAANPLYAVTDASGHFEITGLPPGDYTLAAVHEKLGEKTMTLKVTPKEQKSGVDFSF